MKTKGEAASCDESGADNFEEELDALIKEKGYRPEQIFNVDKIAFYWKKMPKGTYFHK